MMTFGICDLCGMPSENKYRMMLTKLPVQRTSDATSVFDICGECAERMLEKRRRWDLYKGIARSNDKSQAVIDGL